MEENSIYGKWQHVQKKIYLKYLNIIQKVKFSKWQSLLVCNAFIEASTGGTVLSFQPSLTWNWHSWQMVQMSDKFLLSKTEKAQISAKMQIICTLWSLSVREENHPGISDYAKWLLWAKIPLLIWCVKSQTRAHKSNLWSYPDGPNQK